VKKKESILDRLLKVRVAEVGYTVKMKEDLDENGKHIRHYHVYIHQVGLIPYLIGKAYHWYDMRIPIRIPGWKTFIKYYCKLTGAENRSFQPANDPDFPPARLRDRIVGWEYEQDLRCYELSAHGKSKYNLCLDITEEQYLKLRDKESERFDKLEEERDRERRE
jgi:hypothetical protein